MPRTAGVGLAYFNRRFADRPRVALHDSTGLSCRAWLWAQSHRALYPDALSPGLGPCHRQIVYVTACLRLLQSAQGLEDDPSLQLGVEGDAKVVAHHKGHEHRSGRLSVLRDIAGNGDGDGGDASLLDSALHERD